MEGQDTLYIQIANVLETQIKGNILIGGEKLPSLRSLSNERGVSINTVLQSYFELERRGLIESRPRSGYFVSDLAHMRRELPSTSQPLQALPNDDVEKTFFTIGKNINKAKIFLSSSLLAPEMLPVAKLGKAVNNAVRDLPAGGLDYDRTHSERLRLKIAQRSIMWNGKLREDEIVTTTGCMEAISLCLAALTKRGDTIAVESPVYFGILNQARNLGLNVLELPTHPATGIEIDVLRNAIQGGKINVCLFISNFSNPLGSLIPDGNKKEIVRLCEQYNVPLIESDLFGDLFFGQKRPTCCKTYDESGIVLWCGSFSKTLAPGYRVGWVAPGNYLDQIFKSRYYHSLYSASITHEAIAQFIEKDRYENYLRHLRQILRQNCFQFLRTIHEYFPASTRITRPEGGMSLWIELDPHVNTVELYNKAIANKISIAPGRLYTLQDQYNNCFKLSFGLPWNERVENALKLLGKLVPR